MENNVPAPYRGAEITLNDVGRRYVAGETLSMTDENMAMIATAQQNASNFGPDVVDFKVSRPEIPETVKGTLVQHAT